MGGSFSDTALQGCRILIVEDDEVLAQVVVAAIEDAGGQAVGPFATMVEALAGMTRIDAIDGAILDVGLGDENSYPLAQALQSTGIPFLFLTGTDRLAMPAGFDHVVHLLKPQPAHKLVEALVQLKMTTA